MVARSANLKNQTYFINTSEPIAIYNGFKNIWSQVFISRCYACDVCDQFERRDMLWVGLEW